MPFSRPTLSDLRAGVAADIGAAIPGADGLLRFSNLKVLGDVEAGLAHLQYGYLDWIARQAVPFTATDEFLEAWAALKAVTRLAATAARGRVDFTGTNGTVVPAATQIARSDGALYTTDADSTVAGGTVTVAVTASDAGAAGNADVATLMVLGAAIEGVQASGAVSVALTGGADAETDSSLRSRMLQIYAAPPQGGDKEDYIEWARAVPGVTRAWIDPVGMGVGTVVVFVMLDVAEAAHAGFPQGADGGAAEETRISAATGDQLAVADYIYDRQPVTALVYVVAPVAQTIDLTIDGLSSASTATKAAIAAAIAAVFVREASPGGTIDLDDIEAAIIAVVGTSGFVITTPSTNVDLDAGKLPVLGTVTYT